MQTRSRDLSTFLSSLHAAIAERAQADSEALKVTQRIMHALQLERISVSPVPKWLSVCSHIEDAVENVATKVAEENTTQQIPFRSSLLDHAQALLALSSQLAWWHRTDDAQPDSPFAKGHANATVIGKGGLEERDDVWVGISLIAPGIQYPEHRHPPEEVYLVMSPGHWWRGGEPWFEPGIGGLVYNPPNVLHAMRSGSVPLLATWCLWKGD